MADERNRRRNEHDIDPRREEFGRYADRNFDDDYARHGHSSDAERLRTEWHREDMGRDRSEAGHDIYGRREYLGHERMQSRHAGGHGVETWGSGRDRWGRDVYPGDTGSGRFAEDRGQRDPYGRSMYPGNASREATSAMGEHRGRGPRDYTRSDARILEDVCDHLTEDGHVDASDIQVTVTACEVTLAGTVRDRAQKRRAEDLAEGILGVRNVQNNLRVADTAADRSDEMADTVTRQPPITQGPRH